MGSETNQRKHAVDAAWIKSNGNPVRYADSSIGAVILVCIIIMEAGFIMPP